MSNNQNVQNVESNKTPKTWLLFAVLALISLVFTIEICSKYDIFAIILGSLLTGCSAILSVCSYLKRYRFRDLIFETDEERRAREEREAAEEQEPEEDFESSTEDDEESDAEDEEPEQTAEEPHESEAPAKAWNGYNIGDVFVSVPVSCIGNYIGVVADAIKQGKVELAHGLVLDDSNVVKISLNEMVRFGYKAPSGYKIDAKHDTLVALPGNMHYVGNGQFEVTVPNGFVLIDKGECAGEMVPSSMELIKGL